MGPKARAVKFYSTVSDRSEVVHLISRLFGGDGGPGSGNRGHAGRPGQVGGSAPKGGSAPVAGKSSSNNSKELEKITAELKEKKSKYNAMRGYEALIKGAGLAKEIAELSDRKEMLESGLSEPDFRRKKALEVYGTTNDFREAAWLLPDGKMLDFDGSFEESLGRREVNHQDITCIYPNGSYNGIDEVNKFRSDGNIRMYPEVPGINLSASKEPTEEQYDMIRKMAVELGKKRGNFYVDIMTDEGGGYKQFQYDNEEDKKVDPESIVAEIKDFYSKSKNSFVNGMPEHKIKIRNQATDGGPGSGNHGHKGRPGHVGGSAPADGTTSAPSGSVHIKIDPNNQKMVSAPLKSGGKSSSSSVEKEAEQNPFFYKTGNRPESVSALKREYNDLNKEWVEMMKRLSVPMPSNERNKLEVELGDLVKKIRSMREELGIAGEKVGNIGEGTTTAKEKSEIEKCEKEIEDKYKEFDEAEKRGNKLLDEWSKQNVERMHETDPKKRSALAHKVAELAQKVAKASGDKERARKELGDLEKKHDKLLEEADRRQEAKYLPKDPKTPKEFEQLVNFKEKEYVAARNEANELYDEWLDLYDLKQNMEPSDPQWNKIEKLMVEKKEQEKEATERRDNITREINELRYNWRKLDREKEREENRKNPGEYTAINNNIEDIVDKLSKSDRKVRDLNNEITRIKNELGGNIPQERREELEKKLALTQDELKSARTHQDYNEADMDIALGKLREYAVNNFSTEELGNHLHEKANEADGYYRDYEYFADKIGEVNKTIRALLNDGEEEEADRLIKEELEPLVKAQDDVQCRINQIEAAKETLRMAYKDIQKKEDEMEAEKYGGVAGMYRAKALQHFGTTDNYNESGWILSTGELLDYSDGLHDGRRHHDHRDIGMVFPQGAYSTGAMQEFRMQGNIRLYPEIPGINIYDGIELTDEQEKAIRDVIAQANEEERGVFCIDFSNEDGDMWGQLAYSTDPDDANWSGQEHTQIHEGEIDADEVISDLRRYLETREPDEEFSDRGTFRGDALPPALANDGGPGSGNFNHAGRPGEVGGSAPNGSGSSGESTQKRPQAQEKALNDTIRKIRNLKKEQFFLIKEDGSIPVSSKGEKGLVSIRIGDLREHGTGAISIHNHPAGGTFSADDLDGFGFGEKEMIVVGPDGVYALKNKKWDTKERYDGWVPMREQMIKEVPQEMSYIDLRNAAQKTPAVKELSDKLLDIANKWAKMKDEGVSKEELDEFAKNSGYDLLNAQYKERLHEEIRKAEVAPQHDWLKKNAEKYGFEYTYEPFEKKLLSASGPSGHKSEQEIRDFLKTNPPVNRKDMAKHVKGSPEFKRESEKRKREGRPPQSEINPQDLNQIGKTIRVKINSGDYSIVKKPNGEYRLYVTVDNSPQTAYNNAGVAMQTTLYCVPVSVEKGIHFFPVEEGSDKNGT